MSDTITARSTIAPPTSLTAELNGDAVVISWGKPATSILGYNIYQNGEKVAFIPQISPLFEFPFFNESLTEKMLVCSEITELIYTVELPPFTETRFDVTSVDAAGESTPVSLTLEYQRYFEFTSAQLIPNPIDVSRQFVISAGVRDDRELIIT